MTIKHYPKRVHGLKEDFNATAPLLNDIGGWVELGRTTLGGANSTISVSNLPDKRYYMILRSTLGASGTADGWLRVGNSTVDSGNNYAQRSSADGGTDSTSTSLSRLDYGNNHNDTTPIFDVTYVANRSANEKLFITHRVDQQTAGEANAPQRYETASKWDNKSNVIDIIEAQKQSSQTFNSGSEIVVLGWDESDTHTTNFWQELASVELGSNANEISTGTFTTKKYLWVQFYVPSSTGTPNNYNVQVGNSSVDSGTNYAVRYSIDGGTDGTQTSVDDIPMSLNVGSGSSEWAFHNMFVINNTSNEKLFINHSVREETAGATAVPHRHEICSKWDNTSSQINIMRFFHQTGASNLGTGTIVKVWGAD